MRRGRAAHRNLKRAGCQQAFLASEAECWKKNELAKRTKDIRTPPRDKAILYC